MAIRGLTHDENGEANRIVKYRGKISTGYAPGEPPNTSNHPVAAGFFRFLKETTKTMKAGSKEIVTKHWVTNEPVQKEACDRAKTQYPRKIEVYSFYQAPTDLWECSLSMYSSSEGLLCKSNGLGTIAKQLVMDGEKRTWVNRSFDGKEGCLYKGCPDYIAGRCKAIGLMKCFPAADLAPNPYRFETRSINTIIGIESSLEDLYNLLRVAHTIRQHEAGKQLPFDGFFGSKLVLSHRKIKSGGRDVFITDVLPSLEFTEAVMEPIKRGLLKKQSLSKEIGSMGNASLLDQAAQKLIAFDHVEPADVVPMELDDQRSIAVNFGDDNDETVTEASVVPEDNEAAAALIDSVK